MKIPIALGIVSALSAGLLSAQTPSPAETVANVQDERMADIESVQAAIQGTSRPGTKAAILTAFQQRESERAAQAGAASLQAELAHQAAVKAAALQTEAQSPVAPK